MARTPLALAAGDGDIVTKLAAAEPELVHSTATPPFSSAYGSARPFFAHRLQARPPTDPDATSRAELVKGAAGWPEADSATAGLQFDASAAPGRWPAGPPLGSVFGQPLVTVALQVLESITDTVLAPTLTTYAALTAESIAIRRGLTPTGNENGVAAQPLVLDALQVAVLSSETVPDPAFVT